MILRLRGAHRNRRTDRCDLAFALILVASSRATGSVTAPSGARRTSPPRLRLVVPPCTIRYVDVHALVAQLDAELRRRGTPERAEGEKRYLKSEWTFYGATLGEIRAVAAQLEPLVTGLDHDGLLAAVRALWDEPAEDPVFERRMCAVQLLERHGDLLTAGDLPLLERLVREGLTWALVDNLAANVIGPLLDRLPPAEATVVLDRWAGDGDRWVRRTALLAHLRALRAGGGDFDRFARYADAMVDEREFFIRKAIGWVLRDTARTRPELVAAWLAPRTHRASGVTVREAVKPLPPAQADELVAAYRERRPARLRT